MQPARSGHVPVDGLQLYYEAHGELGAPGTVPLLLVPGAFLSTDSMAQWVAGPMITAFLDDVPPADPSLW